MFCISTTTNLLKVTCEPSFYVMDYVKLIVYKLVNAVFIEKNTPPNNNYSSKS
ncbi:MAG: hypothetical protein ACI9E3_000096 [Flavobacteriales bacterium]